MKKTYFSSDYHLSHHNVIKYDGRPFKDIDEMNETIITNHNKIVKKTDDFYFLGDFCLGKRKGEVEELLKRFNGNLHFIKGNHDHTDSVKLFDKYGDYLGEQKMIKVHEQEIVLNHYSMRVWNKSHHGVIHLYGHSHGSLEKDPWGKSMDVGVMNNNYFPYSFEEIMEILGKRDKAIVDYHIGK